MLLVKESMQKSPIMSLQTGKSLGTIGQPIVDPETLKIVAWYADGPLLDFHPAVVFSEDIRELGHLGAIVDSADKIMSPDGLTRLQKILDYGFRLEGLKVLSDRKQKLGTVESYNFDSDNFEIRQILVKPTFGKRLLTTQLIIARNQIKEIDNEKIIVHSAETKVAAPKAAKLVNNNPMPFENPFRSAPEPAPKGKLTQET
jgi:sporulation protein YlmC with PRC-barrel domain